MSSRFDALANRYATTTSSTQHHHQHHLAITPTPEPVMDMELAELQQWQHMTRTVAHYTRHEQIGQGTYGQVYRATCRDTGQIVALKKMIIHHGSYWGMPQQLIREIKILKRLRHPNLLQMNEVVTSKGVEHLDPDDPINERDSNKGKDAPDVRESYKGNLFLVLEYMPHDLTGLMDVAYQFTPLQIKIIFYQLLQAIAYMHEQKYIHRDIKSSNILLDDRLGLKLADFGLARCIEPPILDQMQDRITHNMLELTNKVITLWYRPPEILLRTVQYGPAVDVFSAGCILAELMLGKPLFAGKTEMEQLNLIVDLLGTPSEDTWKYLQSLKKSSSRGSTSTVASEPPPSIDMGRNKTSRLRDKYEHKIPAVALNLLEKLLDWDPRKRSTAANALGHRYFWSEPAIPPNPMDWGVIHVPGGHFHEFQTKKKRRQAKAHAETIKEEALLKGLSEEEAKAEQDKKYKSLMKMVAEEGFDAFDKDGKTPAEREKSKSPTKERGSGGSGSKTSGSKGDKNSGRKSSRSRSQREEDGGDKREGKRPRKDSSGERRKRESNDERRQKKQLLRTEDRSTGSRGRDVFRDTDKRKTPMDPHMVPHQPVFHSQPAFPVDRPRDGWAHPGSRRPLAPEVDHSARQDFDAFRSRPEPSNQQHRREQPPPALMDRGFRDQPRRRDEGLLQDPLPDRRDRYVAPPRRDMTDTYYHNGGPHPSGPREARPAAPAVDPYARRSRSPDRRFADERRFANHRDREENYHSEKRRGEPSRNERRRDDGFGEMFERRHHQYEGGPDPRQHRDRERMDNVARRPPWREEPAATQYGRPRSPPRNDERGNPSNTHRSLPPREEFDDRRRFNEGDRSHGDRGQYDRNDRRHRR